ncbi:hypothetical protein [Pediococcus claussenii]|uniref:Uncharacterized protein n=1 Tax=Pediococcus claussenii (strain ATCC BAA-344 / DSM 14800 / JCM 18046 / KCTC 3811 / LMG 21948 / P06) TaxID=701521 RepID=G8PF42_PEDCP|nr:hypothetical protein [Pediococcus claussenii]AEV95721.1 hypothetical protein PECL_1499 [Pediococcus claussenii ATCC BAA-344]ANZ69229.1 hypothetical protein AYR57_02455 [Pediococcus claussenii]ANZ71048.1 hypothetical protein AYR58_02470 [Pediococcus claussenii]KRN20045.1 hypothetical protein IV79_GL000708 [Pediococcus claussenii]
MFDAQKKRRVSDEVKEEFPEAVINGLWSTLRQMKKDQIVVTPVIAFAFSDDTTDDEIYVMGIQNSGAVAQEYPIAYTGPKDFLGKGTIVIIQDKPKTITMKISELNTAGQK